MISASIARSLIDWYWSEGNQRIGEYHLSKGLWLDQLYTVSETKIRIEAASRRMKGALALWGASQTGKSTLLSKYIDAGADYTGKGSALDWGQPARFSDAGQKHDPHVIVFNPFNQKVDGSACVTRFTMAKEGEVNPNFPVEIRLFQPRQILHALAAGFLSECHPEDENGVKKFWSSAELRTLIRSYTPRPGKNKVEERGGYELLRDVVEVLESMCEIKDDRYRNLLGDFKEFRRQILDSEGLSSSRDSVISFAAKLFWNGWTSITETYKAIVAFREQLNALSGGSEKPLKLFGNLSAARLLVDFTAYGSLREGGARAEAIRRLSCESKDGVLVLTDSPTSGGVKLIAKDIDFALLQALAAELVLPLREDVLAKNNPTLWSLLQTADILDVPGTAKEHEATESKLLTEAGLLGDKAPELFTQVLKRGKTSSMVLSSAKNYDIDGFTIMAKWGEFPGKQRQLAQGVDAWWRSYTGVAMEESESKEIPVNFVVTFLGEMISNQLGRDDFGKLGQIFETFFGKMGAITDPVLSSSFATTYPHIPGGGVSWPNRPNEKVEPADLEAVYQGMVSRPDFKRQFIEKNWAASGEPHNQSLRHAIFSPDGGTDYLIQKLKSDVVNSPRMRKIADLERAVSELWNQILARVVPEENGDSQKQAMVTAWRTQLGQRLLKLRQDRGRAADGSADPAQRVSYWLRKFLHVDSSHLDPSNLSMVFREGDGYPFAEELYYQFQGWKEFVPDMPLEEVCITDKTHAMRLRWYLAEKVMEDDLRDLYETNPAAPEGFSRLLRYRFGNMDSTAIQNALPFLAMRLSRAVAGLTLAPQSHQEVSQNTLNHLYEATRPGQPLGPDNRPDLTTSPHYTGVVAPFFAFLELVAHVPATARGEQPGDESLLRLLSNS